MHPACCFSCSMVRPAALATAVRKLVEVGEQAQKVEKARSPPCTEPWWPPKRQRKCRNRTSWRATTGTTSSNHASKHRRNLIAGDISDRLLVVFSVILRAVAALQTRGYLVWVDTEQMKGSTVDAMAQAVEGAAVMLIGVSRAYKGKYTTRPSLDLTSGDVFLTDRSHRVEQLSDGGTVWDAKEKGEDPADARRCLRGGWMVR